MLGRLAPIFSNLGTLTAGEIRPQRRQIHPCNKNSLYNLILTCGIWIWLSKTVHYIYYISWCTVIYVHTSGLAEHGDDELVCSRGF